MKTLTNTQAAKKMKDYLELKAVLLSYFEGCNNIQQIQSNLWRIDIDVEEGFGMEIKIQQCSYKCTIGYFNEPNAAAKTTLKTRYISAVEAFVNSYFFGA